MTAMRTAPVQRRLLTRRDACSYVGVGLDVFDQDWRPFLPSVPKRIAGKGEQLYDIHDIDLLIESRKQPARVSQMAAGAGV